MLLTIESSVPNAVDVSTSEVTYYLKSKPECSIYTIKFREAVERKHLPLSDPDVMAAARPRIPRNSEYPIPPAKPFASANDIIIVEGLLFAFIRSALLCYH